MVLNNVTSFFDYLYKGNNMDTQEMELVELHYNTYMLVAELEALCAKYPDNKALQEQILKARDIHNLLRDERMGH